MSDSSCRLARSTINCWWRQRSDVDGWIDALGAAEAEPLLDRSLELLLECIHKPRPVLISWPKLGQPGSNGWQKNHPQVLALFRVRPFPGVSGVLTPAPPVVPFSPRLILVELLQLVKRDELSGSAGHAGTGSGRRIRVAHPGTRH
ncbi:hypothetical protein PybrP1_002797 [[Pythium] brassicae (nom. inval.)]|nr:hypothetical protein PybrP1_002797 [[Pythium] brassicae (nom. inval.)]